MNLDVFLQKFDHFADAPNAVARIRELILHSAVTGRLSEKQADDSPVSEILEEGRRIAQPYGRSNSKRGGFEVGSSERPIHVPDHWEWIALKEIGTISGGMTPSKDKTVFWGGSVNWFSSRDIKSDDLVTSELKITREAVVSTRLQVYPPGSLVFVARSGILKRMFPVAILRVEGTVNQDLKVLSPFVPGLERYIQIVLRGMTRHILRSLVKTGMTVQSLKFDEFESHPFPFPPLAEQKRIVAKVDELMALCDRLEAQQKERETRHAALTHASLARFADAPTPTNLSFLFRKSYTIAPADLRKVILELALRGKLVGRDANDEPANATFPRLAAASVMGDDRRCPRTWLQVSLLEVGEWRGGGTPSKSRADFWTGDLPWVSPKDMKALQIFDAQDHISRSALEDTSVRLIPEGSLLMVVRGMILSRAFPVAVARREVTINQDMKALLPIEPGIQDFLLLALRALEPAVLQRIERSSHGTCKVKTESLQELLIPIPPLAEQRRIVAKVDQLMALVDELEAQLAASRTTATKLLDAIVSELTGSSKGAVQ